MKRGSAAFRLGIGRLVRGGGKEQGGEGIAAAVLGRAFRPGQQAGGIGSGDEDQKQDG